MEKAQSESNLSITSNDIKFDLNKEFLVELRKNMYHGTHYEDVVDHIAKVLKMVDSIYVPGVDSHQLRMKVFPLSLADDGKEWWISDENEKIITSEELVEKFFCRFYPESYDGEMKGLTRRIVISSIRSVDKFDDVEVLYKVGMHLEVVVFDPHASDSGCKLVRRGGAEVLRNDVTPTMSMRFPHSASGLPVPLFVIEDLSTRLEVAAGVTIGELGPRVYAVKGQVQVVVSQMAHVVDRWEQVGAQVEQGQQTVAQRDETVVELIQQVQALQIDVQHRHTQIQQLQTTVTEMSSKESSLM
ncbi:hypothetical protein Tco_0007343 [Tanacetum coccineum]